MNLTEKQWQETGKLMGWKNCEQPQGDAVNHPPHYKQGPIEVIEIIEGFNLGYHLGNVMKYVLRAPHKGNELQDLKKAAWYLTRYIEQKEKAQ